MSPSAGIEQLARQAPTNFDEATIDWNGFRAAMDAERIDEAGVLAATWCSFGESHIGALVDSSALTVIHPRGILSGVGKKSMFGGRLKYDFIPFSTVRSFSPEDHEDDRGFGKFCIEFGGAGSVFLGRLQWTWRGRRFKDNRREIIAVAEERDRILAVVESLGG